MEDMTGHPGRCCRRTTPPSLDHCRPSATPPGGQGGHLAANGRPLPLLDLGGASRRTAGAVTERSEGKGSEATLTVPPPASPSSRSKGGGEARHAAALARRSTHGKPGTTFFLNAVFAFAVSRAGRPEVRPAVAQARQHLRPIIVSGSVIGALLAFSTIVVTRWGRPWFAISLGIVVGVMMVSYVAVPSRLIGVRPPKQSRRDKLAGTAVGGALSATVCTPPYVLGRVGILMLGSSGVLVFTLGVFAVAVGITLQAGATGAVRAIKMSATLIAAPRPSDAPASTS